MKLNKTQKDYLKTVESKKAKKKIKKSLIKQNEIKEFADSKKLLKKFFKSIDPNKKKK